MQCPRCHAAIADTSRFCPECGAGTTPLADSGPLLLVDRYRIVRPLARGGMSAVYLAEDTRLGDARVVVKEMRWGVRPGEQDLYASAVLQFKHEATLLAHLQHPNLPRVIDQFEETGNHYLVMDYVPGKNLRDVLREQPDGRISIEQALRWSIALASVLGYLHRQQPPIIYRDLKPANVMLHTDGRVILVDFGIARFYKPGQAGDTAHFGTLGYAPAEQYGSDQTDARSDIYALGVMLHEMISGYNPSQSPFRLPPLRQLAPHAPASLEQAILKATANEPANRWESMAEFEAALNRVLSELERAAAAAQEPTIVIAAPPQVYPAQYGPPAATPGGMPTAHPPLPAPRRRGVWIIGALLLLALIGAGTTWALLGRGPSESPTTVAVGTDATATAEQTAAPTDPPATSTIEPSTAPPTVAPSPPPTLQPVALPPTNVSASSTADPGFDSEGNPINYLPAYMADGDLSTAWRSRQLGPDERGIDEFIEFAWRNPVTVERIGIVPGYDKLDPIDGTDRFTQNFVLRRIRLEFDSGPAYEYDLAYDRQMQFVMVPAVQTQRMRLVVLDTYPPQSADPRFFLAISEIQVEGR